MPAHIKKKELQRCHSFPNYLQISLSRKGSVLDIADFILGEVEVRQISEAVHRTEEHSFQLVLIQSQVMDRVVDVLRDGLEWRLVLTADSQPHIAFVPLNEPTVCLHRVGKERKCEQGGEHTKKESRGSVDALHDVADWK